MKNPKLLLIGAGGHCNSVLDSIDRNKYGKIGIIDLPEKVGLSINGADIIGSDDDIIKLHAQGYNHAFITLGAHNYIGKKIEIYTRLKKIGFSFPAIIDPSAIVSACQTSIMEGVFIGKGVIVNTGAWLGHCCIINTGTIIDHDCHIGSFTHVAPGTNLAGSIKVGKNTLIGIGSSVLPNISIGNNVIIGAGSVVVENIEDDVVAYGVPCKIARKKLFVC